ncbi:TetR/AcrR family transcriptional regulator [Pigmentiphaga sp.]|uniref:TetR/AcrR family transcriptional regulator n=1 Tax=Pigmentiphaga sp. TaxID=1977564 RepID=UPI0025E9A399|nr:TetR/AcrR family transcriptional regulator [Pigmentiphaga sp.]
MSPPPETVQGRPRTRRTQANRSRDARERLLAATIEVLMRSGYNGLTTKEVARCAGMSNGALMHHYATKAELVVAATAEIYEESIRRGQREAHAPEAIERPVEGFIKDCWSVYFDWPFIAAIEVIMVARTDPDLMGKILPVMERYRSSTNALWLEVFRQAGFSGEQAQLALNLSLNLVRGMALNNLWQHDEAHYERYIQDWVRVIYQQFPRGPRAAGAGAAIGS